MVFLLFSLIHRIVLLIGLFGVACGSGEESHSGADALNLPDLPPLASERSPTRGAKRPVRELRIAFTGALRGEFQPCGCPTLPYGGFARRAVFLAELASEGFPVFQLDGGEALLKGVSQHGREDAARRAQALLDFMGIVGVQVMTLGPTDLLAVETVGRFRNSIGPLMLNGGWSKSGLKKGDEPELLTSRNWTVLEQDGLAVAVIGLSADSDAAELADQYRRRDLVEVAERAVSELPESVDLIVGLGSLSAEEAAVVAEAVPQLQLILRTAGSLHQEPRVHKGVVILETPPRGRYVSVLRLLLGSDAQQSLMIQGESILTFEALNDRREQAVALGQKGMTPVKKKVLEKEKTELYESAVGLNLLAVEQRPLGSVFDRPSPVDQRIQSFLEGLVEQAVEVAEAAPAPEMPKKVYATPSNCVRCHIQEFGQWAFSGHKSATTVLTARSAHKNPECLSCHSTGFGKSGGFGDPTPFNLSRLGGVQCEACHGPLAGHPEDESIQPQPVTEQTCLRCHDEANSPEFNFEAYRHKIRCDRQPG
jgi:hypothetical protein